MRIRRISLSHANKNKIARCRLLTVSSFMGIESPLIHKEANYNPLNSLFLTSYLIQQVRVPLHSTLQEHQTKPTNATVSKFSDIENEWWSIRKLVFWVCQRSEEMYGHKNSIFTHRKWWSCHFFVYIWKICEHHSNLYILCKSLNEVQISLSANFFS